MIKNASLIVKPTKIHQGDEWSVKASRFGLESVRRPPLGRPRLFSFVAKTAAERREASRGGRGTAEVDQVSQMQMISALLLSGRNCSSQILLIPWMFQNRTRRRFGGVADPAGGDFCNPVVVVNMIGIVEEEGLEWKFEEDALGSEWELVAGMKSPVSSSQWSKMLFRKTSAAGWNCVASFPLSSHLCSHLISDVCLTFCRVSVHEYVGVCQCFWFIGRNRFRGANSVHFGQDRI